MAQEAPWITTLALGCAGWFLTHAVDRVMNSPTLEYQLATDQAATGGTVRLQLTNLTRDRAFDEVRVVLIGSDEDRFDRPSIRAVQPADDGSSPPQIAGNTVTFTIARMQPGSVYRLAIDHRTAAVPALRITSDASVIRPVAPSAATSFARHELACLLALGACGALGLGLYYRGIAPRRLGVGVDDGQRSIEPTVTPR